MCDQENKTDEINNKTKKIRKQVEYYFSDVNLLRDKFMQEELKNDEGWIPIQTLLKFNRLLTLTNDDATVASAVESSDLLEVFEDKSKIRRVLSKPIPKLNDEFKREIMKRTAYVKNFPLDEKLDNILAFFENFDVENIIMRNKHEKKPKGYKFKGSCFITFPTVEKCKEFVELEKLPYKDVDNLIRKFENDYIEEKREEIAKKKLIKQEEKQKLQKRSKKGASENVEIEYTKGTLVNFTLEGSEEAIKKVSAINIKKHLLEAKMDVVFVDLNDEKDIRVIRMKNNDSVKTLLENDTEVDDVKVKFTLMPEEEEKEYYKNLIQKSSEVKLNRKRGRKGPSFRSKKIKFE